MIEHEYLKHIGYEYNEPTSTFTMDGIFYLTFKYYGGKYNYYKYEGVNSRFGGIHSFDSIINLMDEEGFGVSMWSYKLFKRSETIKRVLGS